MIVGMLLGSVSRQSGGLFTSVRRLSQSIAAANGSEVEILAFKDRFTDADVQQWAPLRTRTFAPLHLPGYALSLSLKKAVLNGKSDLLHLHGIWMYPSYLTLKWNRSVEKPVVVSPRGMLDPWALQNSVLKKKIAGWLYENRNLRSAACIHALCESEYRSIRAYGLTNPVCIIPNGIDLTDLSVEQKSPPRESQMGADNNVMLFLGRIHLKKGLANLIRAWGVLKANKLTALGNWRLVIAGWSQGGHEDELKRLTQELNLGADVSFPGPLYGTAKDEALRAANVFILPSFSEGLPMAVLEAWAYDLPVIMTRECNIPEGFEAGAALDVRPDVDSITEGLKSLLGLSEGTRRQMGQSGLELVRTSFSWPKVASQMVEVYKWVMGQSPKPDCVRLE